MTTYPQLDHNQHPLTCWVHRRFAADASALDAVRAISAITQSLAVLGKPTNARAIIISLKNPAALIQSCPAIHNGCIFEARLWLKQVAAWDTNIRSRHFAPLIHLLGDPAKHALWH